MQGSVSFGLDLNGAPVDQVVADAAASLGCTPIRVQPWQKRVDYELRLPPDVPFLPDAQVAERAMAIRGDFERGVIFGIEEWYRNLHGKLPGELRDEAQALEDELRSIQAGNEDAASFEAFLAKAFPFIFQDEIAHIHTQTRVDGDRKRIDVTFSNVSRTGFLYWMSTHAHVYCPWVMVEAKNYTEDPSNPEFDQLAGRLSPKRGRLGFMVCRTLEKRDRALSRCRDALLHDRGVLLVLADKELESLIRLAGADRRDEVFTFLVDLYLELLH